MLWSTDVLGFSKYLGDLEYRVEGGKKLYIRHGRGTMEYNETGDKYDGPWVEDKPSGPDGVMTYASKDEYVGQWRDGQRHGKGTFTWANKDEW